jgi:hypothetical protein
LKITLERLNIDKDTFKTDHVELFDMVKAECLKVHYEHGLGAVLAPRIHNLFHRIYSTHSTTPEQYEEFKSIIFKIDINLKLLESKEEILRVKMKFLKLRDEII